MYTDLYVFDDYLADPTLHRKSLIKEADFSAGDDQFTLTHQSAAAVHVEKLSERFEHRDVEVLESYIQVYPEYFSSGKYVECLNDDPSCFMGVLFLNLNPPKHAGLAIFQSKETNKNNQTHLDSKEVKELHGRWATNPTRWDKALIVPEKYNRLVVFNSNLFFGLDPKDGYGDAITSARMVERILFKVDQGDL